jgi:hypothetical protein
MQTESCSCTAVRVLPGQFCEICILHVTSFFFLSCRQYCGFLLPFSFCFGCVLFTIVFFFVHVLCPMVLWISDACRHITMVFSL